MIEIAMKEALVFYAPNRGDDIGHGVSVDPDHHGLGHRDRKNPPSGKPQEAIVTQDSYEDREPTPEELVQLERLTEGEAIADLDLGSRSEFSGIAAVYFDEIGLVPLLTPEEETSLAKRIEKRKEALSRKGSGGKKSQKIQAIINDGFEAYQHMVAANTRWVVAVAKTFMGRGLPFLDLVQEGNIGLMKAAEKFDYRRGYRFTTYATWWIRQTIRRAIADQSRTIRIPVHIGQKLGTMQEAYRQFKQENNREPTDQELADSLNISVIKLRRWKKIAREPLSLDEAIDAHDGQLTEDTLLDFIEDESGTPISEGVDQEQLRHIFDGIISSTINPRDQDIFRYRWRLPPYNDETAASARTLEETGEHYHVSKERIRQIDKKMIMRLKAIITRRRLWHDIR